MKRFLTIPLLCGLSLTVACGDGAKNTEDTGFRPIDNDGDGYSVAGGDCDDDDASVHPDADDVIVDGVDQNCDGLDGPDADGDGFVDGEAGGDDCDDGDANVYPGADEIWDDGLDQDCDGVPDVEGASCTAALVITLTDGSTVDIDGCKAWALIAGVDYDPDEEPSIVELDLTLNGVTGAGAECLVHIEQEGVCGTGYYNLRDEDHSVGTIITSDCPGVSGADEGAFGVGSGYLRLDIMATPDLATAHSEDPVAMSLSGGLRAISGSGLSIVGDFALGLTMPTEDVDSPDTCAVTDGDDDDDGYTSAYFDGEDCDDLDATINPGVTDVWYDGVDSDCGGEDDYDADGDGHRSEDYGGDDCDDLDATINPDETETWYDGVDSDCGGEDDYDADGDGFRSEDYGGSDCDDEVAELTPADDDGDGTSTCEGDCNDHDADVYPYDPDGDGILDACGWLAVAGGEQFSCAIDARGLACWGIDNGDYLLDQGQVTDAPIGEDFAFVAAGYRHACALDWSGWVQCWGSDSSGESGDAPSAALTTVSAGYAHSCGIDTSGELLCWGKDDGSLNDYGQVSDAPSGTYTLVGAGNRHTCALSTAGSVDCWGDDTYDQISGTPSGSFAGLAVGAFHACSLDTSGVVRCWGRDDYGQCSEAPTGSYAAIVAGDHHTCLLDGGGQIECFGYDLSGSVSRAPSGAWDSVALGGYHGCAIGTDGSLACWGYDDEGQVSDAP